MKENKSIMVLGIAAIIAILLMVFLFKYAITAQIVQRYLPVAGEQQYPTSIARMYCALPEPRLDLTQQECSRIGWQECAALHGTPNRITVCQQHCGFEIDSICRKASGDYGIGLKYTREPRLGLRRPV